jgi:hypothetical protein
VGENQGDFLSELNLNDIVDAQLLEGVNELHVYRGPRGARYGKNRDMGTDGATVNLETMRRLLETDR